MTFSAVLVNGFISIVDPKYPKNVIIVNYEDLIANAKREIESFRNCGEVFSSHNVFCVWVCVRNES